MSYSEGKLSDYIIFNPKETIKKGQVAPEIDMASIKPFCKYINVAPYSTYNTGMKFRNGDTLLARITPCLENGKTVFVDNLKNSEVGFGSTEYIVMRAIESKTIPEFVYYIATSSAFRGKAISLMTGTSGRQRVQTEALMEENWHFPSIIDQRKIVKILAPLDSKIRQNTRTNDNLEKQGSLLLDDYFSRCDEEIELANLLDFTNGFAFSSKDYLDSGKYKVITIKNVQDGRIDSAVSSCLNEKPAKMKSECELKTGDILLSLTGNVGRVGAVCEDNLLLNQRVAKINPKDAEMLPFLYFLFRHDDMKNTLESISKGTAQQNLSPVEALKLKIRNNSAEAVKLTRTLKPVLKKIISNNIENRHLTALRDTLLPELMNGKIDLSKVEI